MLDKPNSAGYADLLRHQTTLARFGELALRSNDLDEILTEACRLAGEALVDRTGVFSASSAETISASTESIAHLFMMFPPAFLVLEPGSLGQRGLDALWCHWQFA